MWQCEGDRVNGQLVGVKREAGARVGFWIHFSVSFHGGLRLGCICCKPVEKGKRPNVCPQKLPLDGSSPSSLPL